MRPAPPAGQAEPPKCVLRLLVVRTLRLLPLVLVVSCGPPATGGTAAEQPSTSPSYAWAQDCGVTYDMHAPHHPGRADGSSSSADEHVGLSLEEAQARAQAAGWTVRVLGADGDCRDRTDDLRQNRVNVYVADGPVRAARRY